MCFNWRVGLVPGIVISIDLVGVKCVVSMRVSEVNEMVLMATLVLTLVVWGQ